MPDISLIEIKRIVYTPRPNIVSKIAKLVWHWPEYSEITEIRDDLTDEILYQKGSKTT